ncbi:MAG TPA: hypothetical protein PLC65_15135 [Bacteroidia bacterium]|nr:hypothetical protein [Bacteroidia bacterium]HRD39961.1 hypothetical protein [Bacteroidia bacterium]
MSLYKEYSENGELLLEGQFDSRGLKSGLWIEYSRYGTIIIEEHYANGFRHGFYKSYYDNGILWCSGWYKEGKKEGEFRIYDQSGKLKQTRLYFKDHLVEELNKPFTR